MMPNVNTDSNLSAEQRRQAVTAILARGILRYHRRLGRLGSGPSEDLSGFSHEGLEVLDETRLTFTKRVGG